MVGGYRGRSHRSRSRKSCTVRSYGSLTADVVEVAVEHQRLLLSDPLHSAFPGLPATRRRVEENGDCGSGATVGDRPTVHQSGASVTGSVRSPENVSQPNREEKATASTHRSTCLLAVSSGRWQGRAGIGSTTPARSSTPGPPQWQTASNWRGRKITLTVYHPISSNRRPVWVEYGCQYGG